MKQKITVSLVEDTRHLAEEFRRCIEASEDFQLTGWYGSAEEALEKVPEKAPDLLVMDLGLPGMDGADCIEHMLRKLPELKIVAYTVFEDENWVLRAIGNGAKGYLLKDTAPELLLAELRVMHLGGAPITPSIAVKLLRNWPAPEPAAASEQTAESDLTDREREVLNLIALGFKYAAIAERLDISVHTVRRHVEKIYGKLKVHSRLDAVLAGRKMGIVDS